MDSCAGGSSVEARRDSGSKRLWCAVLCLRAADGDSRPGALGTRVVHPRCPRQSLVVDSAMSLCLGPVHACHAERPLPAPGAPLCAAPGAFPFGLFEDGMQRRAVEGITWAALHRLLQLFVIGTQRLARAALRGSAMCMLRCLSGCGSSSVRPADLCLCADGPRAVASVCGRRRGVSWSARQ